MLALPNSWNPSLGGNYAFKPEVHHDREAYFNDIVAAYRQELEVLPVYATGCHNILINDLFLAYFCNIKILKGFREEMATQMLSSTRTSGSTTTPIRHVRPPQDMTIGLHLCQALDPIFGGRL